MNILKSNDIIKNLIVKSDSIYLMGHKDLDLDAIGSVLAMYEYCQSLGKKCFFINNDKKYEYSSKKLLESYLCNFVKDKNLFHINLTNDLLIVMDTNKKNLANSTFAINNFKNILVIDHHDISDNCIEGNIIVDTDASSTCEMITEFLIYNKFSISKSLATALLAGIYLDTNGFALKTTKNTFKMSYVLSDFGANATDVQYLLKNNLKTYIERQKVIVNTKIINKVAITKGSQRSKYRKEELAKIADTLLLFSGIEASFVIGYMNNKVVGISSRSMGNLDVGLLLKYFNGGGDNYGAAAQIENTTISKVEGEVLDIIRNI